MAYLLAVVAILIAYLFGSIPVGVIVGRLYGVDVMASGSGRTGGTNVLRSAGVLAGGLTVLGDILKGLIPVYLLSFVADSHVVVALAGLAAVLGHNYSIFLGFRGGVGAGTAVGVMGGLSFPAALLVAVCALIALAISRYASVLSATVAVSSLVILTVFALLGYTPYEYIVFGALNLGLIFYALRPNFARLRSGTERRIGQRTENIARVPSQRH